MAGIFQSIEVEGVHDGAGAVPGENEHGLIGQKVRDPEERDPRLPGAEEVALPAELQVFFLIRKPSVSLVRRRRRFFPSSVEGSPKRKHSDSISPRPIRPRSW